MILISFGMSAAEPVAAALITPSAAFASSQNNAQRGPINTINNSGLSGPPFDLSSEHAVGENNIAWQSDSEVDGAWIAFDLGSTFDLSQAHVWNYIQGSSGGTDFSGRSMRNIDVYVSSTDTADVNSALFTLVLDDHVLQQPALGPVSAQSFALLENDVRWIRFVVDGGPGVGNYTSAGNDRVGLFEVKFSESIVIPEPSTLLLVLTGVLVPGLAICRRLRNKKQSHVPASEES